MKNYEVLFNQGVEYYNQGDFEKAITIFSKALDIIPENVSAEFIYYNRGLAKSCIGELASGIIDFDNAIKINANYDSAYRNRAINKDDLGDIKGAYADYNKAIVLDPEKNADCSLRAIELLQLIEKNES